MQFLVQIQRNILINKQIKISMPNWTNNHTLKNTDVMSYINMIDTEINTRIKETTDLYNKTIV